MKNVLLTVFTVVGIKYTTYEMSLWRYVHGNDGNVPCCSDDINETMIK